MQAWVEQTAERIAARAPRDLEALVGVSSPSGDVHGAEEAASIAAALAHDDAEIERIPCSSTGHAPDLLMRVRGTGERKLLLLGHLDTVVSHQEHKPLTVDGGRLAGTGSIDMKGGVVLALGVLRALASGGEGVPAFAEVALLLVNDEEWRTVPFGHLDRVADFDACLCFEAGQLTGDGQEAVIVRRKAAGTLVVRAHGRSAHSGTAPEKGINALLALARAAQVIAESTAPEGDDALTAVPTVLRAGSAFNVVPAGGELICDLRSRRLGAIEEVIEALPDRLEDARVEATLLRAWPSMEAEEATAGLLERGGELLGTPIIGGARGGASDASHFASCIPLTVDGLGPRGGGAHAPHEYVTADSLVPRAQIALALAVAALSGP